MMHSPTEIDFLLNAPFCMFQLSMGIEQLSSFLTFSTFKKQTEHLRF